jgi:hypothetical protein
MGGNALASEGARRHAAEEYEQLSREVFGILDGHEFPLHTRAIPSYRQKTDFGDLDILVFPLTKKTHKSILRLFEDPPHVANGDTLSLLYKNLQVDLIPVPTRLDLAPARYYYSYNDLGNLLGKLSRAFGLKYGPEGLWLPVRYEDQVVGEILLSKDFHFILEFLGLESRRYDRGFDTLADIYEFVCSSMYFSREIFQYENLNHANRIRDKKRSTYRGFLEYIKTTQVPEFKFDKDKSIYLPRIFSEFTGARLAYERFIREAEMRKEAKLLYNGELVSEWTGLKEKELGKFMKHVSSMFGPPFSWVTIWTPEQVKSRVMSAYSTFPRT